jgi:hypothetical protein
MSAEDSIKPAVTDTRLLLTVFWSAVILFVLLITFIFTQNLFEELDNFFQYVFFPGIAILTVLGIVLIILAARTPVIKPLRISLILAGSAIAGMPVCVILHNVVYGVFIYLFGDNFWGPNGDEAFFFIMALIVCPLLLIGSTVSTIVLMARHRGKLCG